MTWLDKPDPVVEKKRAMFRRMIQSEIDQMTIEQLAVAIRIAKLSREGDPRILAILVDE